MTRNQADSVARWLQGALGECYDVAVIHNMTDDKYRVAIGRIDSDWPGVVIYKALNLEAVTDGSWEE